MFAYSKNRSSPEVILVINKVLATLYEWRGVIEGVVFSGDIAQAFDSCPVLSVCEALYAAGAHPKTIALFLWEQLELSLHPAFAGLEIENVDFEGILKQGVFDHLFNIAFLVLSGPLIRILFAFFSLQLRATLLKAVIAKHFIETTIE